MNEKIVTQDFSNNYFSKRKKEQEKFQFGVTSTYIGLIGIIVMLLLYYVWILNVNATNGYNISTIQIEKRNLDMEKQRIEVKIAELESLGNIMNEDDLQYMEKVQDPDFLVIRENVQYVYND